MVASTHDRQGQAGKGIGELQSRIDELTAPMLKKTVYVILWTPVKKLADMMPYLEDHLRWPIELEKEGVVFASGPFLGEGDEIPGTGMTMLPADSCAKAEEIAKQDPFCRHGVRTYEVRPWQINDGAESIKVNFSNGGYAFD